MILPSFRTWSVPAFESFDGLRLHYEMVGSGLPIVLLHSFPFDSRVWTSSGVLPVRTNASALNMVNPLSRSVSCHRFMPSVC